MSRQFLSLLCVAALTMVESRGSASTGMAFGLPQQVTRAVAPAFVSAAMVLVASSMPAQAEGANLENGAALFQANCAGCHAGGMNFLSEKKNLKKEALEQYQSLDQAQIQKFVQQGMPHKLLPFSKTLTDKDYFDTTSYVLDQAVNDKW